MLQQYSAGFYQIGICLGILDAAAQQGENTIFGRLHGRPLEHVKQALQTARTWCVATELDSSIKGIDYVLSLSPKELQFRALKGIVGELRRRIEDELATVFLMHVPPNKIGYYMDAPQFGPQVAAKFSEAVTDIQEAGKCLALCRYTACVFHLMRVMEFGVQSLGKALNVPIAVEQKDWGTISSHINGALKRLPRSTPDEKEVFKSYATVAAYLENVRVSWRNPTMHPKASYVEEDAIMVFGFVKQFMGYLAEVV